MSGRIYLTGDTHGHTDIKKLWSFAACRQDLDKDDFVIILGDFGLLWDGGKQERYLLDKLNSKSFTTLWLCGNHENFDMLKNYPEEEWHGGRIHRISDSIYHLCRGHIFDIHGKKLLVMGGGTSIDKCGRTEGLSWWPEENISNSDFDMALANLAGHGNEVDYILTHAAPSSFAKDIIEYGLGLSNAYFFDINEARLEDILRLPVKFKEWYCGHYHCDYESCAGRFNCLYNGFVELK